MFAAVFALLLLGYPVAMTLAGTALISAAIGIATGTFEPSFLIAMPSRLFGIVTNQTLIAVPLFVLMGVILEKSRIAEDLLDPGAVRKDVRESFGDRNRRSWRLLDCCFEPFDGDPHRGFGIYLCGCLNLTADAGEF